MVQRVPQRHFAAPESFVVMSNRGISERAVVAIKKSLGATQHFRKGREDKQAEHQGKTLGCSPGLSVLIFGRRVRGEPHSHRRAICFETKQNPSENRAPPSVGSMQLKPG